MNARSLFAEASPETKLLVASNLAVAQAVMYAGYKDKPGKPMMEVEKQVLGFLQTALNNLSAESSK